MSTAKAPERDYGLKIRNGTEQWPRWSDGYQTCPGCGALVHPQWAKHHALACSEIKRMIGE